MRWILPIVTSLAVFGPAIAGAQTGPLDLQKLPEQIRTLAWKDIDVSSLSLIEQCRALDLLNDALDEIRTQMSADADLLSAYIDAKDLGPTYSAQPPIEGPATKTVEDCQQIAVALLRGPMAGSQYATALAGAPDDQLNAFKRMNLSSCQWKWSDMANSRLEAQSMGKFLAAQGKMDDFRAWVPGELARRTDERKAAIAQGKAADAQKQQERAQQAKARQEQERAEREQQESAMAMQRAMAAPSQGEPAPQDSGGVVVQNGFDETYYGGYAGVGAAVMWRDAGDRARANAAVNNRMSGWRGGGRRR